MDMSHFGTVWNTLVMTIISITVQNENVNDSDIEETKWIKRKR